MHRYHAAEPPSGIERASLSQLKQISDRVVKYAPLRGATAATTGAAAAAEAAPQQQEPAAEQLSEEVLCSWKLGVLAKKATDCGVAQQRIDSALDSEDPKAALIALLLTPRAAGNHSQQPGCGSATQQQQQQVSDDAEDWALTDADRAFLSQWVQPSYLEAATIDAVREKFGNEGGIQLTHFLRPAREEPIMAAVSTRDAAEFSLVDWPTPRPKPSYTSGVEQPPADRIPEPPRK